MRYYCFSVADPGFPPIPKMDLKEIIWPIFFEKLHAIKEFGQRGVHGCARFCWCVCKFLCDLIAFLLALQWKCENLLGEKQLKFTETSTPLGSANVSIMILKRERNFLLTSLWTTTWMISYIFGPVWLITRSTCSWHVTLGSVISPDTRSTVLHNDNLADNCHAFSLKCIQVYTTTIIL